MGDTAKSDGVATNIGIHFFDLLMWLFGKVESSVVYMSSPEKMNGFLSMQNANVRWFLSIDRNDIPQDILLNNKTTYRSIIVDGVELEFTDGFTDLHTKVYEDILNGKGFGIEDARASIETVYKIRTAKISNELVNVHPYLEGKEVAIEA